MVSIEKDKYLTLACSPKVKAVFPNRWNSLRGVYGSHLVKNKRCLTEHFQAKLFRHERASGLMQALIRHFILSTVTGHNYSPTLPFNSMYFKGVCKNYWCKTIEATIVKKVPNESILIYATNILIVASWLMFFLL